MGITAIQQYDAIAAMPPFAHSVAGDIPANAAGKGFGGFTYAGDNAFRDWATTIAKRTGPIDDVEMDQGAGDLTYGPKAFSRLAESETTVLTNIAEGIGQPNTLSGGGKDWSTEGDGAEMKTTFTSGDQMRSMQIKTLMANGRPVASGGAFLGYTDRQPYRIINWENESGNAATDTEGIEPGAAGGLFELLEDIEKAGGTVFMEADPEKGIDQYDWVFTGVAGGAGEIYGGTFEIYAGLRALPGMKGTAGLG